MTLIQRKKPYFCFEHGIEYDDDDLMCPCCEREICEQHDPLEQK